MKRQDLEDCLSAPATAAPPADLSAWCTEWDARVDRDPAPGSLALRGGFAADRVGWAFAAGYQAALRHLLAGFGIAPPAGVRLALCATEEGGNRPRDIQTRLSRSGDGWRLDGAKSWITLGGACTELLVVARLEPDGDCGEHGEQRPALKVARVPADTAGVRLQNKPPLDFVPEIPHTAATLEAVALPADAVLAGDGYDTVVKPFRTVEDTFIALAVHAWLLREARARRWPAEFAEALTANLVALDGIAGLSASEAAPQVALAGALSQAQALYRRADDLWRQENDPAAALWHRDRPLFQVAGKARTLRAQRAWERLGGDEPRR